MNAQERETSQIRRDIALLRERVNSSYDALVEIMFTGCVTNPMTANLDADSYNITDIGKITIGGQVADDIIRLNDAGGNSRLQLGIDSSSNGSLSSTHGIEFVTDTDNNSTNADFIWGTNALPSASYTELMRLSDSGNLTVRASSGVAITAYRVSGQATIKAGSGAMIVDSAATSTCYLNYYVSNNVVLAYGGGNVGIGSGAATPASRLDISAGAIRQAEMTTPSAPAANSGLTFMRDNGSGKTQYCVLFSSGAVQVIATQP